MLKMSADLRTFGRESGVRASTPSGHAASDHQVSGCPAIGSESVDRATVLVVDDDATVRRGLERLLRSAGLRVKTFPTAREFLEGYSCSDGGCLVLDVKMPEITGPELQALLSERDITLPIVFLTGHGDVPTSVRAMKGGAVDFLEKPVDEDVLLDAVRAGLERHRAEQACRRERGGIAARIETLSSREREVMDYVIRGRLNKQIAADLGIAVKTVKVHRARVMEKMEVRSVAELVHLCEKAGMLPP